MFNCDWAQSLTRYDCRTLTAIDGQPCLEIGTPFSLPDGSAINLYLKPESQYVRISDNADTLFQLGGLGLDLWGARMGTARDLLGKHKMQLSPQGEVFLLAPEKDAAYGFALAVTGLLALSIWAAEKLEVEKPEQDLAAEVEPFIIARDPAAYFKRRPHVRGVSSTDHVFDFQHGTDLIDVIPPHAGSTGYAMRKAGDIQNGPMFDHAQPLILVDDRTDPERAMNEIGILGSMTRAMPVTALIPRHAH